MNRICVWMAGALALVACAAGSASAQGKIYQGRSSALVGATTGGDVADPVLTVGATMSVHEESGWGAELDLSYANDTDATNPQADLATVMVNIIWMRPNGPLRPYVLTGAGAIGVHGCLLPCSRVTTTWDLGVGAGGGMQYDLNDVVGLRGDVRYVWAPGNHDGTSRPANFGFWRAAFGVTLSWAIVP